jgi:hypothetical protein
MTNSDYSSASCVHCGSNQVLRDARAIWSVEAQAWELHEMFEFFICKKAALDPSIVNLELPTKVEEGQATRVTDA